MKAILAAAAAVAALLAFSAAAASGQSSGQSQASYGGSGQGELAQADRCAVSGSSVTVTASYVLKASLFNICAYPATRMTTHACLIRRAHATATPVAKKCASNEGWATTSVTVNLSYGCGFTSYPYYWYIEGWGTATFAGQTFTSPVVRGPWRTVQCW